jgi:hypothetical protein
VSENEKVTALLEKAGCRKQSDKHDHIFLRRDFILGIEKTGQKPVDVLPRCAAAA